MRNTNKVDNKGYANTPTSYNITSARLYSNVILPRKNYNFNIKPLIAVIEGIEDLNSPTVEYIIKMGDTFNLLERLKITGGEKIELEIQRRRENKKEKHSITCFIGEIINYKRSGTSRATYTLKCYSEHVMNESVQTLTKPFKGTGGSIVKDILKSDLSVTPDSKQINVSGNYMEGIFPRLRPLHSIFWLMRNSFDDGTPFYFYETLNKGLYYKSFKDICTEDIAETYYFKSFPKHVQGTDEGYEEERTMVQSLSSPNYGMAKFVDSANGAFASTLHEIDISKKEYKTSFYKADKNTLQKLNRHVPYVNNTNTKVLDRHRTEHVNSKHFFISKNSGNKDNYYSGTDISLNKGIAHLEMLNSQTHEISIPGNFDLGVGSKIHLVVYRNKEEPEGAGIDKVQSGDYIITKLIHRFEEGYSQELTIQKDSGEINYETTR